MSHLLVLHSYRTDFTNYEAVFAGKEVTTYSLHPGAIRTELQRHIPGLNNKVIHFIMFTLSWPLIKEPWNGAQTQICCAIDERLANETGKYYR